MSIDMVMFAIGLLLLILGGIFYFIRKLRKVSYVMLAVGLLILVAYPLIMSALGAR